MGSGCNVDRTGNRTRMRMIRMSCEDNLETDSRGDS